MVASRTAPAATRCTTARTARRSTRPSATGHEYLLKVGNASDTVPQLPRRLRPVLRRHRLRPGRRLLLAHQDLHVDDHGSTRPARASSHGHNIISPANGLIADATLDPRAGRGLPRVAADLHELPRSARQRVLPACCTDTGQGPIYDGRRYDFASAAPEAPGTPARPRSAAAATRPTRSTPSTRMACRSGAPTATRTSTRTTRPTSSTPRGTWVRRSPPTTTPTSAPTIRSSGDQATAYRGLVPFEAVNVDLATADSRELHEGSGRRRPGHVPHLPPRARLGLRRHRPLGLRRDLHRGLAPAGHRRRRGRRTT